MQLSEIRIYNYRLLIDAKLDVDAKTTLIVGRNNTAKTSCSSCISTVLQGGVISYTLSDTAYALKAMCVDNKSAILPVLKIPQIVPQLLHHPVTEQINSLSSATPGASLLPLAC